MQSFRAFQISTDALPDMSTAIVNYPFVFLGRSGAAAAPSDLSAAEARCVPIPFTNLNLLEWALSVEHPPLGVNRTTRQSARFLRP